MQGACQQGWYFAKFTPTLVLGCFSRIIGELLVNEKLRCKWGFSLLWQTYINPLILTLKPIPIWYASPDFCMEKGNGFKSRWQCRFFPNRHSVWVLDLCNLCIPWVARPDHIQPFRGAIALLLMRVRQQRGAGLVIWYFSRYRFPINRRRLYASLPRGLSLGLAFGGTLRYGLDIIKTLFRLQWPIMHLKIFHPPSIHRAIIA